MSFYRIPSLELVFSTVRDSIHTKHDLAIAAVHSLLLGKGLLLACLGDDLAAADAAQASPPTELLPAGWNSNQDVYTLQYVKIIDGGSREKYLLKACKIDGGLHLSLLRQRDEKVTNASIDVSKYITDDISTFDKAFKSMNDLSYDVTKELLQLLDNADASQPAVVRSPDSKQPAVGQLPRPTPFSPNPMWLPPAPLNPFEYGRSDLDPLGGGLAGGSGMIMDPMRQWHAGNRGQPRGSEFVPGGLPRGAVPPGARFDPFGPPLPAGFLDPRPGFGQRGPDPDHLPPPGYGDMFM